MSQRAREVIQKWIQQVVEDPEPVKTRHLYELGITNWPLPLELLETVFHAGVETTEEIGGDWRFALVVPLTPSEHLRLDRCRELESYLQRQCDMQKTFIVLLPPDITLGESWPEEYRFPLARSVPGLDPGEYKLFFRQERSENEIDLDDVFYDSICFEQRQRRLRKQSSQSSISAAP